jgi:hypothetical protein
VQALVSVIILCILPLLTLTPIFPPCFFRLSPQVGQSGVGKTSIANAFEKGEGFGATPAPTIFLNIKYRISTGRDGNQYKLMMWGPSVFSSTLPSHLFLAFLFLIAHVHRPSAPAQTRLAPSALP